MAEIPGYNPQEAKQLYSIMEELTNANALLPIVLVTKSGNKKYILLMNEMSLQTQTYMNKGWKSLSEMKP